MTKDKKIAELEKKLYRIAELAYATCSPLEIRMIEIRKLTYEIYKANKELKVKL